MELEMGYLLKCQTGISGGNQAKNVANLSSLYICSTKCNYSYFFLDIGSQNEM